MSNPRPLIDILQDNPELRDSFVAWFDEKIAGQKEKMLMPNIDKEKLFLTHSVIMTVEEIKGQLLNLKPAG